MTKPVQSRSFLKKTGVGALVLSLIFIVGMIKYVSSWDMFYSNPVTVDSVVLYNEKSPGGRGIGPQYSPVVSYECDGQEYTELVYRGDSSPIPEGSHLTLTVDRNNPTKQLSKPEPLKLFIGITLTVAFTAVSIAAFVDSRKAPK